MWSGRLVRSAWSGACKLRASAHNEFLRLPRSHAFPVVNLHTSHICAAKLFVDRENQFAHDVLEQSLKPYQLFRREAAPSETIKETAAAAELEPALALPSTPLTSVDDIFLAFCAVARYCAQANAQISDQRFQPFSQLFCERSNQLSDEQLLTALRHLAQLPDEVSVKAPNYVEIWNNLDVECCRRVDHWNTDQLLLFCDVWYAMNLARISDFVWEALRRLGRKVRRMRPEQLVQSMFYCNVMRRPVIEMFDFEANLFNCAASMSLQELGVMSMGFFKTQTPIRNPELLAHLYKRLMTELDTVEDITLVAIMKVLRYSSKLPQVEMMMQLLEALCAQVERLSLLSCLHVALFGVELQCCHDGILELILQRFNREVEQARLKDLERICLAIGVFNYHSPTGLEKELCAKILKLLQSKVDEILKYPRCFPNCLHYLTQSGHYDAELISAALETRFVQHAYGKNMTLGREIFQLDSYVKINLQQTGYEGHQLPEKYRRTMGKLLTKYIPERNSKFKLNRTDRILVEIKECLDRVVRPNSFKHILPHFERPDLIVCYNNAQRKAVPLAAQCAEDYSGAILTRQQLLGESESPEIATVAIVVAGWNNVVRDKDRFTGSFNLKLQQLALLMHKPIVIFWHEWRELETQTDRQNFLKRKLANVIKL